MTRSRLPRTTTAIAALACLALVAAACGGGSSGSDSAPEDPQTAAGDVDEPTAIDGVATSDTPVVAEAPVSEGQIIEDVIRASDTDDGAGDEISPSTSASSAKRNVPPRTGLISSPAPSSVSLARTTSSMI